MHRASRVDPGRVQTPSPSSATSSNSKLTSFAMRARRVQTVGRRSSSRPMRIARFAPCLGRLSCAARGLNIAIASGAKRRHADRCRPCSLRRLFRNSSLVSYGMSLDALQDFLPLALTLNVKTVRYDTRKVAKRLEAELGDEPPCFIDGSPSHWVLLPQPEGAFTVGIDGGYVRHWCDKKHNFEVIVGKSTLSFGEDDDAQSPSHKRLGFVQTLDTQSKRRLHEVLQSQGLQRNQPITFLSDGDDTLRKLQVEMSPMA